MGTIMPHLTADMEPALRALPALHDSDPDMDEALRRVRENKPRPSNEHLDQALLLLALELDLLPSMGCGTCSGWGTILDHQSGKTKTCPTCNGGR